MKHTELGNEIRKMKCQHRGRTQAFLPNTGNYWLSKLFVTYALRLTYSLVSLVNFLKVPSAISLISLFSINL